MSLADRFLGPSNRIQWRALAAAIGGASVYAAAIAWLRGFVSLAQLPAMVVSGVTDAFDRNLGQYLASLEAQSTFLFEGTMLDLGVLQLPFRVVLLLLLFTVAAWGVSVWRN